MELRKLGADVSDDDDDDDDDESDGGEEEDEEEEENEKLDVGGLNINGTEQTEYLKLDLLQQTL